MLIRSNAGLLGLIIISHNIRRFFSGAISQPAIEPMLSECCQSFSSLLTQTTSHEEETIDFLPLLHISMLRCIHSSFSNCKQVTGVKRGNKYRGFMSGNIPTEFGDNFQSDSCESFNNLVFSIDVDIFSIRKKIALEQNCLVYLEDSNLDSPLLLNTGF